MSETKTTLSAWKKAKIHSITLPSGTAIEIQIPNLPAMIKAGVVPNTLIQNVVRAQTDPGFTVSEEMLKEQAEFVEFIVPKTVVSPTIAPEDVESLPYEDVEMILDFAMRNRDLDALGHHLAGLETQSEFRRFRGLDRSYETPTGV